MKGPSELHVTGELKDWDIVNRLGEIQVPTLVLSGRYDEADPAIAKTVHHGIPGSISMIFEHSSHMPHLEEPELFKKILTEFLGKVES
jgi:L-proline amide hydrolase